MPPSRAAFLRLSFLDSVASKQRWEGSTRTFASLLKTMVAKDVIAYASFIGRRAARPQIVVLLPQVCCPENPERVFRALTPTLPCDDRKKS